MNKAALSDPPLLVQISIFKQKDQAMMSARILIPVITLLLLKINAIGNFIGTDSLNRMVKKSAAQDNMKGIEYVDITGVVSRVNDKFVLQSNDRKIYRLNCTAEDCSKYIGRRVNVHGILMQGYDNPKYGNQNLPISQVAPADIINIITSVTIEPLVAN